ncbi:hypothetical protein SAMD00019534_092370 [Acytostelium subglobosum LB1]|uniref:hypothetical protein n=1 Tax=Acytostelium subglobosum LB1 TaxID=1410327 RepID=UPI0006452273|nr:hypothetical protein SAMD00019534_092370 [Acytostelium subglobosum LB1]GAM26062.1 hypothetical protein SAMD00019534_092370 [Acytostelium subglobosum LB1]|eukprot:XP_012751105.1 hypothetical protein SAMD00019534_092370 [Acytostelium subglobosum LB1]
MMHNSPLFNGKRNDFFAGNSSLNSIFNGYQGIQKSRSYSPSYSTNFNVKPQSPNLNGNNNNNNNNNNYNPNNNNNNNNNNNYNPNNNTPNNNNNNNNGGGGGLTNSVSFGGFDYQSPKFLSSPTNMNGSVSNANANNNMMMINNGNGMVNGMGNGMGNNNHLHPYYQLTDQVSPRQLAQQQLIQQLLEQQQQTAQLFKQQQEYLAQQQKAQEEKERILLQQQQQLLLQQQQQLLPSSKVDIQVIDPQPQVHIQNQSQTQSQAPHPQVTKLDLQPKTAVMVTKQPQPQQPVVQKPQQPAEPVLKQGKSQNDMMSKQSSSSAQPAKQSIQLKQQLQLELDSPHFEPPPALIIRKPNEKSSSSSSSAPQQQQQQQSHNNKQSTSASYYDRQQQMFNNLQDDVILEVDEQELERELNGADLLDDEDPYDLAKFSKKDVALINAKSEEGSVHTFSEEEKVAYSKFISEILSDQQSGLSNYIPIDSSTNMLFTACSDGVLLNKLMEAMFPSQVDLKGLVIKLKINPFEMIGNQNIVIKNATKVGCVIVNIGAQDLVNATPYLVLGIIWQIIKAGLLSKVNQNANEILDILFEEEDEDMMLDSANGMIPSKRMLHKDGHEHSAEQILIRWVNFHLEKAKCARVISNFSEDIQDSVVYSHLFAQLVPPEFAHLVNKVQSEPNLFTRAEYITEACGKLGVKCFLTPSDIALGHPKLNLALVASLFNSEASIADMRQRLEGEKSERDRLEREKMDQSALERERREFERLAREREEQERAERLRLEQERKAQELEELERAERQRAERERLEREIADLERAERERKRAEREMMEEEWAEREREERERYERDKADRERYERDKMEQDAATRERRENNKEFKIVMRIQKRITESPEVFENLDKLKGEITELKRNIIGEMRTTTGMRADLRRLTKTIDVVRENRAERKKLAQRQHKRVPQPNKGVPPQLNEIKMKNYQSLFHHLQTHPKLMGRVLYLLSSSQLTKTSQNVLLSMFPFEVSPREEDLFLKCLSTALDYQMAASACLTDFVAVDSVPTHLLYGYFKKRGYKYLQDVIAPMISKVLSTPELNLNFDPLWINKELQNENVINHGASHKHGAAVSKTHEQALEDPKVATLHNNRLAQLLELAEGFFDRIVRSVDQIPAQIRYMCREVTEKARVAYGGKGDPDFQVPYYCFIYRFVAAVIASPDLLNELVLQQHPMISFQQRANLSLISRVLQSAFSNTAWQHTYQTPKIASWIDAHKDVAAKFLYTIPDVPDLDDLVHFNDYNDIMNENGIHFCTVIGLSEVIWMHETIASVFYDLVNCRSLSFEEVRMSDTRSSLSDRYSTNGAQTRRSTLPTIKSKSDDDELDGGLGRLQTILNRLESPLMLPEQGDRVIQLTFINHQAPGGDSSDSHHRDQFKEAKRWMIDILAKTPSPRKDVNTIKILQDAIVFCKSQNNTAENMSLVAKCDQLIDRLRTFRQELVSSEPHIFDIFLLQVEMELEMILRKNKLMRSELTRLYSLLKATRVESAPLQELVKFQEGQLAKAVAKKQLKHMERKSEVKIKPVKQTLLELVKRGVVVSSEVPEAAFGKTNVTIKPVGYGIFEIEARLGTVSKTVVLDLDRLLEFSKHHVDEFPLEGITLDVNVTIHVLKKQFNLI